MMGAEFYICRLSSDQGQSSLHSYGRIGKACRQGKKRYLACSRLSMNQTPPRDDDPSNMTDFEKNVTFEALEQLEQDSETSDSNRIRQERGKQGLDKQPGFGQGA